MADLKEDIVMEGFKTHKGTSYEFIINRKNKLRVAYTEKLLLMIFIKSVPFAVRFYF